ncbi:MAG: HAMP domain-containing sensor histidine kinase [Candidatus Paceibacterota bacterium]|jgi:signal transduction histidine kinase
MSSDFFLGFISSLFLATGFLVYGFKSKMLVGMSETKKYRKLLLDQEKSGKLLIRRDLELTKANEKLHALDERKSEFVSIVAHQLRTPLSGIKWTLNMLIKGEFGQLQSEQQAFLMKAYENNQRLIVLVEDMLSVDRIESGKSKFVFTEIQLLDLFDNVLFEVHANALQNNVTIEFGERPGDLPKVSADAEQMRAVVQNLLDNAVRYTPKGGKVRIDFSKEGDSVKVAIKDNGIGIPEAEKVRIFNRFFRSRNAIRVKPDGSGLGLFIVKGIIERHGGNVWFESKEGEGTTFFFTVKAATAKIQ